ncbi:hypothetical protein [Azorhizobium sp. AG788]|uniref:hypothetical protein n=1 Tax=Azorhizobium sp. AG788 TaxID=2183897 RepID=UPI003138ECDB
MTLADLIVATNEYTPFIGVFHSTNNSAFANIISCRELRSRIDRNGVVFVFYGKPSYTLKNGGAVINEVSFAFGQESILNYVRAIPFDSGGLASGKYSKFFSTESYEDKLDETISYFSIPSGRFDIGRFIATFFGTNENYIMGRFCAWSAEMKGQSLLTSWAALVNASSELNHFDPPATTIEITINSPIKISKSNVNRVILPFGYLDRPEVLDFIKNTGIKFDTYEDEVLVDKSTLWNALNEIARGIKFEEAGEVE